MDIIDAGDACEWHLEDQFWTQDGQGAFQLRSHRGVPLPEALGDLDFLIATRRCPRCRVSAFLPAAFRHCPHCGAPLGAPGETQPWLPPYGQTGGWRCHERAGSPAGALLERLLARPAASTITGRSSRRRARAVCCTSPRRWAATATLCSPSVAPASCSSGSAAASSG